MKVEALAALEVCDAFAKVYAGTAYNAMDVIAFLEKEFTQIRAVLACYASN